jgi:hypothetical protein
MVTIYIISVSLQKLNKVDRDGFDNQQTRLKHEVFGPWI